MPELIVVMVLTVIFSGMVISFSIDLWGRSANLTSSSETLNTRQNLGDALRDRFNAASVLLNQNSIADAHVSAIDPADVSGTHWLTLHAIPHTIPMPEKGVTTPVLYYAAPSVDYSYNFIMNDKLPYEDEFVLFLDGTSKQLRLRTLANPAASGNRQRTSCPPKTAGCREDNILAEDVTAVSLRYFSRSGNPLDWSSVHDPLTGEAVGPDFPVVEVIEITVGLKKRAIIHGSGDSISQTTIRVALRNG